MTAQDDRKLAVAEAAIAYVTPGTLIGVGTGSTAAYFVEALGRMPERISGAVASSERTAAALRDLGIPVHDAGEVTGLTLYVDGADEVDPTGALIKGGGGALTREKIVAALAERFLCIVDDSKLVDALGAFPVPIEVIPMAAAQVARRLRGPLPGVTGTAEPVLRRGADGAPYRTDNGGHILDVAGLRVVDPAAVEDALSVWPGVVTVGVFAHQRATTTLVAGPDGVRTMAYGR